MQAAGQISKSIHNSNESSIKQNKQQSDLAVRGGGNSGNVFACHHLAGWRRWYFLDICSGSEYPSVPESRRRKSERFALSRLMEITRGVSWGLPLRNLA